MSYDRTVYSYDRTASEEGGSAEFQKELLAALKLNGRRVLIKNQLLGRSDAVYINFINLPEGVGGAGGGAEVENNRMLFRVEGFDKTDEHAPPPTGKVKVELQTSALPREHKLRAKAGTPSQIAKYLADFINKIVKDVEPKYTHTKVPS
mgnify:CR=1 FL=1